MNRFQYLHSTIERPHVESLMWVWSFGGLSLAEMYRHQIPNTPFDIMIVPDYKVADVDFIDNPTQPYDTAIRSTWHWQGGFFRINDSLEETVRYLNSLGNFTFKADL